MYQETKFTPLERKQSLKKTLNFVKKTLSVYLITFTHKGDFVLLPPQT